MYPASYSGVISVGAIRQNNRRAYFSNYNNKLSVVAPGYQVQSTASDGGYKYYNGTSFSAPYVSGIAAFIKAVNPELENNEIAKIIMNTSNDLGAAGKDNYYGFGKVNFNNAIDWVLNDMRDDSDTAAIPSGSVVLGNKGFDLDYANNLLNSNEITNALVHSNGLVYVKKYNGEWINNNTGGGVQPDLIPAVEYKDKHGFVTFYKAGDGKVH